MTLAMDLARLHRNLGAFEAAVKSLAGEVYLARTERWSPRDIVAHLVGWNRYVVRGSEQLMRGELPFYDEDPGENFANVNATHLVEYPSEDRDELLAELRRAVDELCAFLAELPADAWATDFGVRHGDEVLTIQKTVNELIDDYETHRSQLESWSER